MKIGEGVSDFARDKLSIIAKPGDSCFYIRPVRPGWGLGDT